MKERIIKEVNSFAGEIIRIRRELHRIPEPGFKEVKTAALIARYLEEWGLEVKKEVGRTGVVALLRGARPGRTIAIRADIDALPVTEKTGLEFASEHKGYMHACGHDGHTAIALGTARILARLRDKIAGNVKFIFQPAEEGPGGAKEMIKEGVLKDPDVDAIIGLHIWPDLPSGTVGVKEGPIMAAPDCFDLKIIGLGGHGAVPHRSVDPIVVGSKIVSALQTLVSREVDPLDSVVITIGKFQAGTTYNVIPNEADIAGTVRTFDPELRKRIPVRMEEIIRGISAAMRTDYQFDYYYYYPATVNDPEFTDFVRKIAEDMVGPENVVTDFRPSMGGEDFSYFLQEVPGTFFFLGTRNEEKGLTMPIHHPEYDIDEDILPLGTKLFCLAALTYLNR